MRWGFGKDYSTAEATFARFRVDREGDGHAALIYAIHGARLDSADGFPTEEAAQAWCVDQYRALLEAELKTLG